MTEFKQALDDWQMLPGDISKKDELAIVEKHWLTIRRALKIAEAVCSEPTENMLESAKKSRAMDYFYDMGPNINNRPIACWGAMVEEMLRGID